MKRLLVNVLILVLATCTFAGSQQPLDGDILMGFIAVNDAAATKQFYGGKLGFKLLSEERGALVYSVDNRKLRIQVMPSAKPVPFTVLGWEVTDIRATVAKLRKRGVRFEISKGLGQDSQGVMRFPDKTCVAWFKDPSGNTLSLAEFKPKKP